MNLNWQESTLSNALRSLGEGAPRNLVARALPDAQDRNEDLTSADLTRVLLEAGASGSLSGISRDDGSQVGRG